MMRRFRVFFFWETEKMDLKYTKDYIVDECSAAPVIDGTERCGLVGDHRRMCKFGGSEEQGFRTVVVALRRYERLAQAVIEERWDAAERSLLEMRRLEAGELVGGYGGSWNKDAGP
jgi:protein SERAC1